MSPFVLLPIVVLPISLREEELLSTAQRPKLSTVSTCREENGLTRRWFVLRKIRPPTTTTTALEVMGTHRLQLGNESCSLYPSHIQEKSSYSVCV